MAKAYSYVRFSTPEQAKGDSYRRQIAAAKKYAIENGLDLVTADEYSFFDRGVSAFKGKNKGPTSSFNRFKRFVETGNIEPGSYLLVESLDRISREEVSSALTSFLNLLELGINIVTLEDRQVYKKNPDINSLIYSIIHMSRAHSDSLYKGDRIAKTWEEKRVKARESLTPIGGVCPYWIEFVDGKYKLIEEHAAVVRRIFDLTIQGYGFVAITTKLNAENIPVFGSENRNKSRLWGKSSISKILHSRAVLGEYQPKKHVDGARVDQGAVIKNYYPAVISEDVFYSALSSTKQRLISKSTKQSKNFNVWSKVAKCSICKSSMHLVNKGDPPKGRVYLRCSAAVKGKCSNRSIRIEDADVVLREVLAKTNSLPIVSESHRDISARISELRGREEYLIAHIATLVQLLDVEPSPPLAKNIADKDIELKAIRADIEAARSQLLQVEIFDKNEFFKQLDLVAYEGRAEVNEYLRFMKSEVSMNRTDDETLFALTIDKKPVLAFVFRDDSYKMIPLTLRHLTAVVNQSDLSASLFPYTPTKMLSAAVEDVDGVMEKQNVGLSDLKTYRPCLNPEQKAKLIESFGLKPK